MLKIILLILGIFFLTFVGILGVCFYFYTQALKEAYEEGWDMPN
jgi:uncharacterized protein YpmB